MTELIFYIENNKTQLAEQALEWMKENYPDRTDTPDKCTRDINFLLDAYVLDLKNSTSVQTTKIANSFWSGKVRQVKTYNVEFDVHKWIVDNIKTNVATEHHSKIDALLNTFLEILENGPSKNSIVERWQTRYTVRSFFEDEIPDVEKINQISEVIKYIPSQNGVADHQWVLLTPEDKELKEWLVENVYNVWDEEKQHREYFTMIQEAPYVFHSFRVEATSPLHLQRKASEYFRTNGFHAGAIVGTAVQLELDVAQICCNDGILKDNFNWNLYKEKIWNRFGSELSKINVKYKDIVINFQKENISDPSLTISLGVGKPLTAHSYTEYKDGVTFTGQKQKKWFNNFVK